MLGRCSNIFSENSNGKPINMHFLVTSAGSKYCMATVLWGRRVLVEERYLAVSVFLEVRMKELPEVTVVATVSLG